MSRSYRHFPFVGLATARSEKKDKQAWHRRFRRLVRARLRGWPAVLPHVREVSDVWNMSKDGRHCRARATARDLRKALGK